MKNNIIAFISLAAAATLLCSCSGESGGESKVQAESVTITADKTSLTVGEDVTFTITTVPENADVELSGVYPVGMTSGKFVLNGRTAVYTPTTLPLRDATEEVYVVDAVSGVQSNYCSFDVLEGTSTTPTGIYLSIPEGVYSEAKPFTAKIIFTPISSITDTQYARIYRKDYFAALDGSYNFDNITKGYMTITCSESLKKLTAGKYTIYSSCNEKWFSNNVEITIE